MNFYEVFSFVSLRQWCEAAESEINFHVGTILILEYTTVDYLDFYDKNI